MSTESTVPASIKPAKHKHRATISGWDEALRLLGVLLVAVIIWLIPPPSGVEPKAWHLLAIFVATIVGIIVKPLPMGAMALLGIAATALSGTLTINQALSGFGNSTIWLIVVSLFSSPTALSRRVWVVASPTFLWRRSAKNPGIELRSDRDRSGVSTGYPQQHSPRGRNRVPARKGVSQSVWK